MISSIARRRKTQSGKLIERVLSMMDDRCRQGGKDVRRRILFRLAYLKIPSHRVIIGTQEVDSYCLRMRKSRLEDANAQTEALQQTSKDKGNDVILRFHIKRTFLFRCLQIGEL